MCLLIIVLLVFPIKHSSTIYSFNNSEVFPSKIIRDKKEYSQDISCPSNEINMIGMKLSTYNVINEEGSIFIKVSNKSTGESVTKTVDLSELTDNNTFYIDLNKDMCKKNAVLNVTFGYDKYVDGNSLAYWFRNTDINKKLKVDGKEVEQEISFVFIGKKKDRSYIWYPLVALTTVGIYYCIRKEEE